MSKGSKEIEWRVEGSNWSWRGNFPSSTPPEEVATRVIEALSRPSGWTEEFISQLTISDGRNPHVGMIMMISNSKMKSPEEHLVVMSSSIMANAGLHIKASQLKDAES